MRFRWIEVLDGGGDTIPADQEPTATEAANNAGKKTPGSFTVQKLGLNVVQGGLYQFSFAYLYEDPENPSETIVGARSPNFRFNLDTPDLTKEVTNLVVTPGLLAYGVKWDPIDKNLPANKWFIDAQIYESLTGAFAGEEYLVWNGTGNSATILVSDTNNRWIRVYTRDADFHRKGVTYGPFKATDPIVVDVTGPGNVSSVTTNGGLDTTGIVGFNGYSDISWPAVTGGGIRGYRIRFRPVTTPESSYSYADSPGTGTSYRLAGLGAGLVYEIAVATYDEYNNTSSSYIAGANVTVGGTPYIASTVDVSGFFRAKANPNDADSTAFKFGYGIETGKRGLLFNASNYWHIDSNQSALFKVGGPTANYLLWNGTKLTVDGDINAKGGTFSGNIFMSTTGASIYSGTIDTATGNLTGNGFALNSTGLKVANGTNSVTLSAATGTITANAGSIASWNLSGTTLSKNNIILDSAGQIQVGSTAAQSVYLKSSGSFVMWAGNNTPDANAKFRVGVDGTLYATGAVFGTGTTVDGYATTGTVTGLNTRLTTAEGTVSTLGTNVTTLSTSVGTISSGLATKNTTFVGGTAPTANRVGDIWIDTSSGNELKTWTGSVWTTRRDTTFAKTTDLGTKLNASASIIQSTTDNKITANASGLEIFSGSANSGLKFTGTGLFGYKNGNPTFTITSGGDATFYGTLSAATGSFSGAVTATSGVIGGFTLTGGTDFTAKLDVNPRILFGNKVLIGSINLGGTNGEYGVRIGNPYGDAGHSFRVYTQDSVNRITVDTSDRTYAAEIRNIVRAVGFRHMGSGFVNDSSRRFKENIVEMPKAYYEKILDVPINFYTYKNNIEEIPNEMWGTHNFGPIVEDMEDAGLGFFVERNLQGQATSFRNEQKYAFLLIPIVRDMKLKIEEMEAKILELESR